MSRTFGGVKTAAKVDQAPPVYFKALPGEPFDPPTRVPQTRERQLQSPFASKRNHPTPNFLDYATYYLAGVMCEQQGHIHPEGQWPCKPALVFAWEQLHILAERKIPPLREEQGHGAESKEGQKSGEKSGKKSGAGSGRKSGRGR